jgi:hypothetical protein
LLGRVRLTVASAACWGLTAAFPLVAAGNDVAGAAEQVVETNVWDVEHVKERLGYD